jgi:hypothetical protein
MNARKLAWGFALLWAKCCLILSGTGCSCEPEPTQVLPSPACDYVDAERIYGLLDRLLTVCEKQKAKLEDHEAIIDGICERARKLKAEVRELRKAGCKCESCSCKGKSKEAPPLLPPQRRKAIHRTDGKQKAPVCHAAINSVRAQCRYSAHPRPGGVCDRFGVDPVDTSLPAASGPVRPEVALRDHPRLRLLGAVHGQGYCGPAAATRPETRRGALLRGLARLAAGADVRMDTVESCRRQCKRRRAIKARYSAKAQ